VFIALTARHAFTPSEHDPNNRLNSPRNSLA
jgi:hypothetical protein